ncbi:MAG TPA: hypothetical protein VFO07_07150 [Roseiflexaceae bacterium]|nr:hypothetical protein [Roseiflexaceae bacterium]
MKTRMWMVVAGIALAIVAAIAIAPAVFAQGPAGGYGPGMNRAQMMDGTPGPGMGMRGGMGPMQGRRGGMGGPQQSLVAVAADTLNMTQAALVTELQGGKSIAQVAAEKKVALDTIVTAFIAPRKAHLESLVADGQLTQAQMDSMLATMKTNVTTRLNQPGRAQGGGPGSGFVDEDGDGVCDHAGSGPMGNGPRAGRPQGEPRGRQGR